jgi:DNA-directed RNA polymerase
VLLETLRDVFKWETAPRLDDNPGDDQFLTYTDGASEYIDVASAQIIESTPIWWPLPELPKKWTAWNEGGTWDARSARTLTIMRERQVQTKEAVQQAIRDGTMRPAVDALNSLQSVPWMINKRVLAVIRECATRGIDVAGLPSAKDPTEEDQTEDPSEEDQTEDKFRRRERRKDKIRFKSASALFKEDMCTAEQMATYERRLARKPYTEYGPAGYLPGRG